MTDDRRERRARQLDGQAQEYRIKATYTDDVADRHALEALAVALEQAAEKLRKVTTMKEEIKVAKEFDQLAHAMLERTILRKKQEKPH